MVLAVVTRDKWAQKPFCDDGLTAFVSAAPESTDIGKWRLAELFHANCRFVRRSKRALGLGGSLTRAPDLPSPFVSMRR